MPLEILGEVWVTYMPLTPAEECLVGQGTRSSLLDREHKLNEGEVRI